MENNVLNSIMSLVNEVGDSVAGKELERMLRDRDGFYSSNPKYRVENFINEIENIRIMAYKRKELNI